MELNLFWNFFVIKLIENDHIHFLKNNIFYEFFYEFSMYQNCFIIVEALKIKKYDVIRFIINNIINDDQMYKKALREHIVDELVLQDFIQRLDFETVEFIINDIGVNITYYDADDIMENIMETAVSTKSIRLTTFLLNKGFSIKKDEKEILTEVVIENDLCMLKLLVEYGANIHIELNSPDIFDIHSEIYDSEEQYSLLTLIFTTQDEDAYKDMLRFLIEKGIDVHRYQEQALRYAIQRMSKSIIRILVEHGGAYIRAQNVQDEIRALTERRANNNPYPYENMEAFEEEYEVFIQEIDYLSKRVDPF